MTQATGIRVMIVDDHAIMRAGLKEVLERSGLFQVVGEAGDGEEAVAIATDLKPDVIIMDVLMPVKNGIDACREISSLLPDTRLLILTASTEEKAVIEAVAAGANGYLQKFSDRDHFLDTVRDVAAGEYRLPGEVIRRVFGVVREVEEGIDHKTLEKLTAREREILALFSSGMSYAEIADVRGNRPLTIRNAVYGIQDKVGASTKQELVVWAVRNGLVRDI